MNETNDYILIILIRNDEVKKSKLQWTGLLNYGIDESKLLWQSI